VSGMTAQPTADLATSPKPLLVESRASVRLGDTTVGRGEPCYIVAEIGINHNGDLDLAKRLVRIAAESGCNAVKFQKRTPRLAYTPEELAAPRASPFGMTNGDLKRGLELDRSAYEALFALARDYGVDCFASVWDVESIEFLEEFDPPCHKIPSPLLIDAELIDACRATGRPLILSTGMSTHEEIQEAVERAGEKDLILLSCTSAYPCPADDVNLARISRLRELFACPVGYSGHELGVWPSIAAAALGADLIERHVTVSRRLWGSDQKASLEPSLLARLVEAVREIEPALGSGELRLLESELPAQAKLRRA
jgi:N-acetylneuraminate synthase